MDRSRAVAVFESLASGQRLDIFCALVRTGMKGMVAGEVAAALGIPATNLSFHLKSMLESGLVTVQQEGRFLRYRANIPQLLNVLAFTLENCACTGAAVSTDRPESAPGAPP